MATGVSALCLCSSNRFGNCRKQPALLAAATAAVAVTGRGAAAVYRLHWLQRNEIYVRHIEFPQVLSCSSRWRPEILTPDFSPAPRRFWVLPPREWYYCRWLVALCCLAATARYRRPPVTAAATHPTVHTPPAPHGGAARRLWRRSGLGRPLRRRGLLSGPRRACRARRRPDSVWARRRAAARPQPRACMHACVCIPAEGDRCPPWVAAGLR